MGVERLVRNAKLYNGSIVTVEGCYLKQFELEVILPCAASSPVENAIWVAAREYVEETERVVLQKKGPSRYAAFELSPAEKQLYMKLLTSEPNRRVHVVVQGEFQTGTPGGFGGGFPHRLVLLKVLKIFDR
jgi:hypothetical protein